MKSSSVKKRGENIDRSDSHIYRVLLPLIKHFKEEYKLTKEDLISIIQNSILIK